MKNLYQTFGAKTFLALALMVSLIFQANAQKMPGFSKIDPRLLNLQPMKTAAPNARTARQASQPAKMAAPTEKEFKPYSPQGNLLVIDGYVSVEFIAVDNTRELLSQLEAVGLKNGTAYGGMVSGMLPVDAVKELTDLSQLRFARPGYFKTNIGATTTQGDLALLSDEARNQFKVTGKGNKVGVLSDSYNSLGGAPAGIASGDLPGKGNPNGYLHPVEVLQDLPKDAGSDEGRAMIEIVHDIAPSAEIAFHTAFAGQANFAQGIIDLADTGANIIVDDVFYFAEPFFQDGIIAQAVDEVSKDGVAYFSSAGNSDRDSYESEFRPTADTLVLPIEIVTEDTAFIAPSSYVFHDFDPGPGVDIYQKISFAQGANLFRASVQWDEPFASVCEGCPGAQSDLDVFVALKKDTGTIVYDASSFFSNIDSDPVEIPVYSFTSDTATSIYLLIGKYVDIPDTPDPGLIKYISFNSGTISEYATASPTVVGHSNATSTISVGASFFFRNPLFFPDIYPTPAINSYSSAGGVPILFDTKGKRIKPKVRVNPDITGPDAGNTTFFIPGLFIGFEIPGTTEPDEFPQFTGTSASAPHVAAVAALMNEAANETLDPKRINEVLQETATDMDDPATKGFDEGYDFKTGAGFVNAQKAVATVFPQPSVVSFTLINAETDEEIGPLGDRIELSQLPGGKFNIRADVIAGTSEVGSVILELEGPVDSTRVENKAPYALFGDKDGKGDYYAETLPAGEYTLKATPFTGEKGKGDQGVSLEISFEVTRFPVAALALVDAATDSLIEPLENGDVINLVTTPDISIVAFPEFGDFTGSIVFLLNGEQVQVESKPPYALAGDDDGDIRPVDIAPGEYTLTAIPYSQENGKGTAGNALTVRFEVVERLEVTALVLVNADTEEDVTELTDGITIPIDQLPHFNVRAEVNSDQTGSVEFQVNGTLLRRDNSQPFTLGDESNGNYQAVNLPAGNYTLTATPFGKKNGLGAVGISLSVRVVLQNNLAVVQFLLIDAEKDEVIQPLAPGDTLDLDGLPPVNIQAVVNSDNTESVAFMLNDERVAIENDAPYAIGGDKNGDFRAFDLDIGAYILTATPYSADDLKGTRGTSLTVGFVVIDADDQPIVEALRVSAYPNPVAEKLTLTSGHPDEKMVHYTIMDNLGRTVDVVSLDAQEAVEINISPYANRLRKGGLFYVKVISETGTSKTFRLKLE